MDAKDATTSSNLLRDILNGRDEAVFFETTWQRKPEVFLYEPHGTLSKIDCASSSTGDGNWNDDSVASSPLHEMIKQRWQILRDLLDRMERRQVAADQEPALIFQDRELQSRECVESIYGSSLYAPYLNGCSVVINHADLASPWIAAACEDLQKSFPHAYANCYLTPPNSQAVPAHADDRDVLVIQLVGAKEWKVYRNVPVPYPYPQEQVGKQGVPVPKEVLEGPTAIATTLNPGDVLYMPRGFVHEACCSDILSLHATVALATHDWTLAGVMSIATEAILARTVDFRRSILPLPLSTNGVQELQEQVDSAIQSFKDEITAEGILKSLKGRLELHNQRARPTRMQLIQEARLKPSMLIETTVQPCISGPVAATSLSFDSCVRAATPEERAAVAPQSTTSRGLHVREAIADYIMGIIGRLKADPSVKCTVLELRKLMPAESAMVCDLSLLSLAKRAVELGAFCVVPAS